MPVDCVWFDDIPDGPWQVGWCFPMGMPGLSHQYLERTSLDRKPITVCLPDRRRPDLVCAFCVDIHPTSNPDGAWVVEISGLLQHGEQPDITVTPSVNIDGAYHGYITHGVVTDDLGA